MDEETDDDREDPASGFADDLGEWGRILAEHGIIDEFDNAAPFPFAASAGLVDPPWARSPRMQSLDPARLFPSSEASHPLEDALGPECYDRAGTPISFRSWLTLHEQPEVRHVAVGSQIWLAVIK